MSNNKVNIGDSNEDNIGIICSIVNKYNKKQGSTSVSVKNTSINIKKQERVYKLI
jgi:hypothetical protein